MAPLSKEPIQNIINSEWPSTCNLTFLFNTRTRKKALYTYFFIPGDLFGPCPKTCRVVRIYAENTGPWKIREIYPFFANFRLHLERGANVVNSLSNFCENMSGKYLNVDADIRDKFWLFFFTYFEFCHVWM